MHPEDFDPAQRGLLLRHPTDYWAFVPSPLPPAIGLTPELLRALSDADRAIGELAGAGGWQPDPHILIDPFLRREAVLSSRIEGTIATVTDLALFEVDAKASEARDAQEVLNYVRALELATDPKRTLPLSLRLIRDLHRTLMTGVRGIVATPGEFRRTQNWIGPAGCLLKEATFVPPPVDQMTPALHELEAYLHGDDSLPSLIRIALVHYQFEAIHPFLDGNGRIGRLLVSLLMQEWHLLPAPLLYLSAFFESRRDDYYRHLLSVSTHGTWDTWIRFFLEGVASQSRDVIDRARRLTELREDYHRRVQVSRASALLLRLVDHLFERPAITVTGAKEVLGVTFRAASQNVQKLVAAGILHETTGRERNRIYVASEILDLL
ncbi:MAG: Fic family protein [Actinomycetota bacterium]|nr:Fic family protein [Actinomycetota bacterium]